MDMILRQYFALPRYENPALSPAGVCPGRLRIASYRANDCLHRCDRRRRCRAIAWPGVESRQYPPLSHRGTGAALTVWVRVSGVAVQGEDYTFGNTIGNAVVIPAGSASQEIPVTVLDDWPTEGTEDMRIRLDTEMGTSGTPVPYTIGAPDRAPVNIADNEDPLAPLRAIVTVAAVDAVATETAGGSDPAVFRITRSNNLIPALNIRFTLGATAEAGADYPSPPAMIAIPAGDFASRFYRFRPQAAPAP